MNPRGGGAGRPERSARWSWSRDFVKLRGEDTLETPKSQPDLNRGQ
jgi:hypothetical protein